MKLTQSLRQQTLNIIEKLDTNEGIDIKQIVTNLNQSEITINEVLEELIKEGEIFQIKNKFKIVK